MFFKCNVFVLIWNVENNNDCDKLQAELLDLQILTLNLQHKTQIQPHRHRYVPKSPFEFCIFSHVL